MTFSTYLSPGVAIQGGGGSGGGGAASAPLTGTGATITTSQPLIDVSQTWNNAAVTFTSAKINVTDTASAAASLLMDLQVGVSSKFKVDKTGLVTVVDTSNLAQIAMADRGTILSIYTTAFGVQPLLVSAPGGIAINNDTGLYRLGASQDVNISREAAGILRVGTTAGNALGTLKAAVVGTTTAYTVATLPTGFQGARAYVTDALAPTFLGTLTGGGAVVCPVFYNGTAWVPA